ncbi:NUDIX hydrolase, partial [Actinomadura sp. BRA 177]|uniref:NUDIX hydrolase n=1 Tax=Actinomadura sp. BRA 177 TaxID=2745202 RepID=UPI00159635CD
GAPSVILIKRAYRGRNAGQWGLPGGRLEAGETPAEAALRGLHEEIGLAAATRRSPRPARPPCARSRRAWR